MEPACELLIRQFCVIRGQRGKQENQLRFRFFSSRAHIFPHILARFVCVYLYLFLLGTPFVMYVCVTLDVWAAKANFLRTSQD